MTPQVNVSVPEVAGIDLAAARSGCAAALRQFRRSVRAEADPVRVKVVSDPSVDAVALAVDGRSVRYPPLLAQRVGSYVTGAPGLLAGSVTETWQRVGATASTEFVVELVRGLTTEAPELLVGPDNWLRWRSECDKSLDVAVAPGFLRSLTTALPREMFSWLRSDVSLGLGLPLPPIRLTGDPALPARTFAVELNGIRTTPYCALEDGWLLSNVIDNEEPTAVSAIVPTHLGHASLVPGSRQDALRDRGITVWDREQYFALCIYAEIQRHADWFVDDEVTDGLLDQLEFVAPATVEAARAQLGATLSPVLTELVGDRLSIRPLGAIVLALLECSGAPERPAGRIARDRLAASTTDAASLGGSLSVWILESAFADAIEGDLDAVCDALRRAVDALVPMSWVPALLVAERYRAPIAAAIRFAVPEVRVLSFDDVPADRPVNVFQQLTVL